MAPGRREKEALILVALLAMAGLYFGWRVFWFLTDDAYIAFRYVSNSLLGYGYVWNPPPFRPVEGYSSFLWVVTLDVVWRLTGVQPPDSANWLSLGISGLTLLLGGLMALRLNWRAELRPFRVLFLGLLLFLVFSNRTFLAWTSSGLETALFNFLVTAWVAAALYLPLYSHRWLAGLSVSAALVYLTRPDGLLLAAFTVALVGLGFGRLASLARLRASHWANIAPLLAIPLHVLWRRLTYGEWLPNTYYAKAISGRIWFESGWRYALSFIIEYALWIWLLALVAVVLRAVLRRSWPVRRLSDLRYLPDTWLVRAAVIAALVGHWLYYTVVIGGDHFEYRVYSHLVLLLGLSFLWMLNYLRLRARVSVALLILFILCSWPIPWSHWAITHSLTERPDTLFLKASVSEAVQDWIPAMPASVIGYLRFYDDLQFWLISHAVCMRHQEHKIFHLYLVRTLPTRAEGLRLAATGYPVVARASVGVLAWALARVNVIDVLGLNDYVIARNDQLEPGEFMAHERRPPAGYVECFGPNVYQSGEGWQVRPRPFGLTAEAIVACEQRFAKQVDGGS
jgi:arabinofuranosyltransferase